MNYMGLGILARPKTSGNPYPLLWFAKCFIWVSAPWGLATTAKTVRYNMVSLWVYMGIGTLGSPEPAKIRRFAVVSYRFIRDSSISGYPAIRENRRFPIISLRLYKDLGLFWVPTKPLKS